MKGFSPEHIPTENLEQPPKVPLSSELKEKLNFAQERSSTMDPVTGELARLTSFASVAAANDEHFESKESANNEDYRMAA